MAGAGQKYHNPMERIKILIHKLKEQFDQNEGPDQLFVTSQLLQLELMNAVRQEYANPETPEAADVSLQKSTAPLSTPQEKSPATELLLEKVIGRSKEQVNYQIAENKLTSHVNIPFDPLIETPTLFQQQATKEINESISVQQESLNDRLKQARIELGEVLKEVPIRDLRKAIGVNDRFVFINDLFRGDEAMYERSIKTINSLHVFSEAEYWIKRELIVKVGWDANSEIVKYFFQLVKRRFS